MLMGLMAQIKYDFLPCQLNATSYLIKKILKILLNMIKIPKSHIEDPSLLQVTAHNPKLHVLVERKRVRPEDQ